AVESPPREHGTVHSGPGLARPRILPMREDLERAAAVLNDGKKVALLVGQGAIGAHEEVQQVADTLGAGVAKALLGKTVSAAGAKSSRARSRRGGACSRSARTRTRTRSTRSASSGI